MTTSSSGYVALVGRPNVGKSTLFNRLTKSKAAIVHDEPGVTRDRHYGRVADEEGSFTLIDTGGFEPTAEEGLFKLMRAQVEMAVDESDAVIFLVDGRQGLTAQDEEIATRLRRKQKNVVVAVNKLDSPQIEDEALDFYSLGLGEPLAVSAAHGLGVSPLIDRVREMLPEPEEEAEPGEGPIKVAVVGRPNVGKSSLVNHLTGSKRVIVSDIPGTTRDAIDTLVNFEDREYLFIDTAGIRKAGKIGRGIEKWSVIRALKAMDRADVALVLIDAEEGLTDQEARVCGLAVERGVAVILAVNKWDLVADPDKYFKETKDVLAFKLKFLSFVPWLVISAKTGRNTHRIFKAVEQVYAQYTFRASTSDVNRVLEQAMAHHPPPLVGRHRLKFLFATQVESAPPTFVIFTNKPELVHFSYSRYLSNQFQEAFGLDKIPIRLVFRERKQRDRK